MSDEHQKLNDDEATDTSAAAKWQPRVMSVVVAMFVVWHLFNLVFRNVVDLAPSKVSGWIKDHELKAVFDPVDEVTKRYTRWTGVEQGWRMFTSPLWRKGLFAAVRIEFTDGSKAWLVSDREPDDLSHFFRHGTMRLRKLEDQLVGVRRDLESVPERQRVMEDDWELPVWERYIQWRLDVWRERHPDDERTISRVVLVDRQMAFPKPGEPADQFGEPTLRDVLWFDASGRLEL